MTSTRSDRWVAVRAPAKLNLFLELLRRRADGYHEIDTVMVPIDCYDTLLVRRAKEESIRITTQWWPSRQHWLATLGGLAAEELLQIPEDERNLIHRAIKATTLLAGYSGGFEVRVRKRTPVGAGMGGASSDAAAAIRATASLLGIAATDARLFRVAGEIGSDVPFFLGNGQALGEVAAMHATGRGEKLASLELGRKLHFLVAYPAVSLSTALVYGQSSVPTGALSSAAIIAALATGDIASIGQSMSNRLTLPATKLSPVVADLLEQMWRCGLPRCQLTGSGAACFSLLDDGDDGVELRRRLTDNLRVRNINAKIILADSTTIPQPVREDVRLRSAT